MPMPTFATEAEIPEPLKPDYVQVEGGAWRSKTEIDLELATAKHATLLDETKTAKRTAREIKEENERLRAEAEAREKGASDADIRALREQADAAKQAVIDELNATKAELNKVRLTDRAQTLALRSGVMPDRIKDCMTILTLPDAPRIRLGDDGEIVVLDESGKRTGQDVEAFLAKTFKNEKPWLYEFEGGSGSGSGGSQGNRGAPPALPPDTRARKRSEIAGAF